MKVYFIEARSKYSSSWTTLNYTLNEREAFGHVIDIEAANPESEAQYYVVNTKKDIVGYDNGGGQHFVCLVRVCRYDSEKVSKVAIFNTREEALEYIKNEEDDYHYCTLDGIQLASERKSWKAGKYSNWA